MTIENKWPRAGAWKFHGVRPRPHCITGCGQFTSKQGVRCKFCSAKRTAAIRRARTLKKES